MGSQTVVGQELFAEPELRMLFSYRVLKRALDIVLAVLLLPLLAPVLLCIAIAVRLDSRGPIFFGHSRHRDREQVFTVWKFRTMRENAATVLHDHLNAHPEAMREWQLTHKLKNDPRVTGSGHFLRRTSLDELPQIWNVLIGNMSFVGPRPITTAEIERYGEYFASYCRVKPGITGLWQVSGRNVLTYLQRVQLDATYANTWSFSKDLRILLKTFGTVWFGHGAY